MIKNLLSFFRLLWGTQKRLIAGWALAEVALCVFVRLAFDRWNVANDRYGFSDTLMACLGVFQLGWFVPSAYLAFLFHFRSRKSWMRQLPFSDFTVSFGCHLVLILNAVVLYLALAPMWDWEFMQAGLSTVSVLLLIPFLIFYIAKSTRSYFIGLIAAGVVSLLMLAATFGYLGGWIRFQWQWNIEAVFIGVTFLVVAYFEIRNLKGIVAAGACLVILLSTPLLYQHFREPQDFYDVVHDLKTFPTRTAVGRYRDWLIGNKVRFTSDKEPTVLWLNGVWKSHLYATAFLTEDERATVIKGEIENFEKFVRRGPEERIRWSIFPYSPGHRDTVAEKTILANWKDDLPHCMMLRGPSSEEALRQLLESHCVKYMSSIWAGTDYLRRYLPGRDGPYEKMVDNIILSSYQIGTLEGRATLASSMRWAAGWDDRAVHQYPHLLEDGPVSPQVLGEWKRAAFKKYRKEIAGMKSMPRPEFVAHIESILQNRDSSEGYQKRMFLYYLCDVSSQNCGGDLSLAEMMSLKTFRDRTRLGLGLEWEEILPIYRALVAEANWSGLTDAMRYSQAD